MKKDESPPASKREEIKDRMVRPAMVKVRVNAQPICEDQHHEAGSEFETTPERASALGDLVTRI